MLLHPPQLWLIRLMSASLLVLLLSMSLILLMNCLEAGAVILIVDERVTVVENRVAEVPPLHLHSDAASGDTSWKVGDGAGEVSGVDLQELRDLLHDLLNIVGTTLHLDDSLRSAITWKGSENCVTSCTGFIDAHPKFVVVILGLYSWRALPVPLMMKVQFPHVSSLELILVLLARTICAADDAAGAISAHLKPLLDPCAPGAHYLCR